MMDHAEGDSMRMTEEYRAKIKARDEEWQKEHPAEDGCPCAGCARHALLGEVDHLRECMTWILEWGCDPEAKDCEYELVAYRANIRKVARQALGEVEK